MTNQAQAKSVPLPRPSPPGGEGERVRGECRAAGSGRGLMLAALGLGLSLLLVACEVTPYEEFTPQLVVHGQLQVGNTDGLRVTVNRTYRIDDPEVREFPDADVRIRSGHDTILPMRHHSGDVHDRFYPRLAVRPGDTFSILVAKDGFDTVSGRTVIPDTFHFLYPRQGDTVTPYDSLGWTRSRTAAGYYFSFVHVEDGDTSSWVIAIGNDSLGSGQPFDSVKVHIGQMLFYYVDDPGWKKLTVYAVDSNYYDWVRTGGFGSGGVPPETTYLAGGLGVFGSAAVETLSFYLKRDTAGSGRHGRAARQGPSRPRQRADVRMQDSGRPDAEYVTRDRLRRD